MVHFEDLHGPGVPEENCVIDIVENDAVDL
jgi:hypothetical protein